MGYLDLRELAEELEALQDRAQDEDEFDPLDEEECHRLDALLDLEGQLFTSMEEYANNEPTMIPEDEFVDYAQEFAYDVGYINDDHPLSYYIDWERWAVDLAHDYTEVTFDGDTYLIGAH